jgi:hypothetical protein
MPPSLLTVDEQRNVIAVLMAGGDLRMAADYIARTQVAIRATAEANENFRAGLDRAEPHFELAQLGNITKAAMREQYWRAAAWMLERKFPSRYGKIAPEAMSPSKVKLLLEGLADIIFVEVRSVRMREKILLRLRKLLARIKVEEKKR